MLEIKTPEVVGYQYISTYNLSGEQGNVINNIKPKETKQIVEETNTSERSENFPKRIHRFLQEHITVVAVSSVFLLVVIIMFYIWWKSKGNRENKKSQDLT